jgi:hypothetical protein
VQDEKELKAVIAKSPTAAKRKFSTLQGVESKVADLSTNLQAKALENAQLLSRIGKLERQKGKLKTKLTRGMNLYWTPLHPIRINIQ